MFEQSEDRFEFSCQKYAKAQSRKSLMEKLRVSLPVIQHWSALLLLLLLLWATVWGLIGEAALPRGHIFALIIVVCASYIAGEVISYVKCPPLLGMLLMGFILRNVPVINIAKNLNPELSSTFRSLALVVILLRAGSSLDPAVLKKLSFVCVRLAFTPCLVEATASAIIAHYFLALPWLWSFMLGFIVAAVSPAVVVPCMIALQEKGLGTTKGIPTLVIAAASVDDVVAITGFGILLGITFSQGDLVWTIMKGPVQAVLGILYGIVIGFLLWHFPNKSDVYVSVFRVILLFFGGCCALFGSKRTDLAGAGALACLGLAFFAAHGWRKQGEEMDNSTITETLRVLWLVLQPALFGLIGAELKLSLLDTKTISMGLATLAVGLTFRLLATFLAVTGAGFTLKERLFIALAWIPKATVQAAIGSVALDLARGSNSGKDMEELGVRVLTVAVLSILLTAPFGALAIAVSAPKCLDKEQKSTVSFTTGNAYQHNTDEDGEQECKI